MTAAGGGVVALTGATDGQIVNVTDDAPTSVFEMAQSDRRCNLGLNEPLPNPWMGRMDGSKRRGLGLSPTMPTVYQAAAATILQKV